MKTFGYDEGEAMEVAEATMKKIDSNMSGSIDYSEFVRATISKE